MKYPLARGGYDCFQFPLWDTAKTYPGCSYDIYFFQFPLWDTNEILESVYKKEDITFNSLYGIHKV